MSSETLARDETHAAFSSSPPEEARTPPAAREPVIDVRGVSKAYRIYPRPFDRFKQAFAWGRRQYYHEFWALRDVSFEVGRGEAVGIIGRNGSGKSTLLQIIAGTLTPTAGEARVAGRVAALLELGSGFNPDFTGRENVYMNGAILGLPAREIDAKFGAIAAFADIGEFIDQPVKTYSSGMMLRLAFAVQVQVRPDILIVDEALAVGDALFQKRCFQKIEELRGQGVTLLFVSHDMESIRTLTTRAVLLHEGRVRAHGSAAEVVLDYRRLLHEEERKHYARYVARGSASQAVPSHQDSEPVTPGSESTSGALRPPENAATTKAAAAAPPTLRSDSLSFGDFEAEITSVRVLNSAGEECSVFYPGDRLVIRVAARVHRDLTRLNVAVRIRNKEGVKVYSWGTLNRDMQIWSGAATGGIFWERRFAPGEAVTVDFECDCALGLNFYEVQAAISEEQARNYTAQRILHWRDEAAFFQVLLRGDEYFFGGAFDLRMTARVHG